MGLGRDNPAMSGRDAAAPGARIGNDIAGLMDH
jgi:hypothetical protein